MICPSAPPSASNPKVSGANWLDSLRSSRGFPPADAIDLDLFIAGQNPPSSTVAEPPRLLTLYSADESRGCQSGGRLREGKGEDVSDILCDLFAMGGGGRRGETSNRASNGRKSSRKQQNPRFWDATGSSKKSSNGVSSDDLKRRNNNRSKNNNPNCNNNGLASSGDHSLNQHHKERDSKDPGELGLEQAEEQEVDLKGYSKSEVTVIDSSIQGWKVELFVFRKRKSKSMWKVREKTSRSKSLANARRKRKLSKPNCGESNDDDDDDNGDVLERREKKMKKKKMTVRASVFHPGNTLKNGNGKEDAVVPLNNEGQVQEDKVDKKSKEVVCLRGEASVKSSHWKSRSESSSVILIKPLSTFDKSVTRKPGP